MNIRDRYVPIRHVYKHGLLLALHNNHLYTGIFRRYNPIRHQSISHLRKVGRALHKPVQQAGRLHSNFQRMMTEIMILPTQSVIQTLIMFSFVYDFFCNKSIDK